MTLQGKHVLVLEDEPIIAFALEDMLIDEGASVAVASSLSTAMALVEDGTFGFAMLDVNVHGEKSYPVAATLIERAVPFVFATGYGDAEHPEEFAAIPTITKPYAASHIRSAAAEAFDRMAGGEMGKNP